MTRADTVFDALPADRAEAYKHIRQLEQLCREHEETIDFCDQRIYQLEKYAQWYEQEYEPKANERIEHLEQLCRDMYYVIFDRTYEEVSTPEHSEFMKRMDALGLLEGDSYD